MSGVADCGPSTPSGTALDTSTPGWHTFTTTSRDAVGNVRTVEIEYAVSAAVCTPLLVGSRVRLRFDGDREDVLSYSPAHNNNQPDAFGPGVSGQAYRFSWNSLDHIHTAAQLHHGHVRRPVDPSGISRGDHAAAPCLAVPAAAQSFGDAHVGAGAWRRRGRRNRDVGRHRAEERVDPCRLHLRQRRRDALRERPHRWHVAGAAGRAAVGDVDDGSRQDRWSGRLRNRDRHLHRIHRRGAAVRPGRRGDGHGSDLPGGRRHVMPAEADDAHAPGGDDDLRHGHLPRRSHPDRWRWSADRRQGGAARPDRGAALRADLRADDGGHRRRRRPDGTRRTTSRPEPTSTASGATSPATTYTPTRPT